MCGVEITIKKLETTYPLVIYGDTKTVEYV